MLFSLPTYQSTSLILFKKYKILHFTNINKPALLCMIKPAFLRICLFIYRYEADIADVMFRFATDSRKYVPAAKVISGCSDL